MDPIYAVKFFSRWSNDRIVRGRGWGHGRYVARGTYHVEVREILKGSSKESGRCDVSANVYRDRKLMAAGDGCRHNNVGVNSMELSRKYSSCSRIGDPVTS